MDVKVESMRTYWHGLPRVEDSLDDLLPCSACDDTVVVFLKPEEQTTKDAKEAQRAQESCFLKK